MNGKESAETHHVKPKRLNSELQDTNLAARTVTQRYPRVVQRVKRHSIGKSGTKAAARKSHRHVCRTSLELYTIQSAKKCTLKTDSSRKTKRENEEVCQVRFAYRCTGIIYEAPPTTIPYNGQPNSQP